MRKYLSSKKTSILTSVLLVISFLLGGFFSFLTTAQSEVSTPSFPACETRIFSEIGDWAHYDFGVHGIPGIANLDGSDDVYSLTSGNFLQCFCPSEGFDGFQTNWWNIERAGLTDEQITQLQADGWINIDSGVGWNLFDERYLAKNSSINCEEPEPTPTPTQTPTPTVTPTVTPTPGPEAESRCVALSASPSEGTAPLTVKFTGSGFDEDGDIQRYKFDFGDTSGDQPQVWEQDESEAAHRYENPGTFTASLSVRDSRGNWRDGEGDCRKTITVNDKPQVLGTKVPEKLPTAGAFGLAFAGLIPVGAYLYRRFKLL